MNRKTISLNRDWLFSLGSEIAADSPSVCLPHTISLTPANSSGGRNAQGLCCYQKDIFCPASEEGQKIFLIFEGAMGESDLYVNGMLVQRHFCGFTPLSADVTPYIGPGKMNRIFLLLDNSDHEDIPPGKSQQELDYTYDGGLYRDAWLRITSDLYITDPLIEDRTESGIMIWYTDVSEAGADVHVSIEAANDRESDQLFELAVELTNPEGRTVASWNSPCFCKAGGRPVMATVLHVSDPFLWAPESPCLYGLHVKIIQNGVVTDEQLLSAGIHSTEFTRGRNLLFNGKSRCLSGANYHQTWPYLGNGVPDRLLIRDVMKLKQLGMENIRGHYPFCEAFTDACDRLGMTLIVSLPGWQFFKEGIFVSRCEENLRAMIRWHRNHASVLIWEPLPNETEMPFWFQKRMLEIVDEELPHGCYCTGSDYAPTRISYREFDPGMLSPGTKDYGRLEAALKDNPLWVREYGDCPDNWTDQSCAWRVPRGFGDTAMVRAVDRMLGKDPQMQGNSYLDVYSRKDLCGYGIWPGIEHNRGYHILPCYGGFLDLFRLPKFTAEFIKCQQDASVAGYHLFIANWMTEYSPDDVNVYSNADSVRLYYDGEYVGEALPEAIPVKHPPFRFQNVRSRFKKRDRGTLTAQAVVAGNVVAEAVRMAPGVPKRLALEADLMELPFIADGSDVIAVHCRLLDRDGNTVPWLGDRLPVLFTLEGEGEIIGDSSIGANPVYPEAGIASLLVRSTQKAGAVTIHAEMLWPQRGPAAIEPAALTVESGLTVNSLTIAAEGVEIEEEWLSKSI